MSARSVFLHMSGNAVKGLAIPLVCLLVGGCGHGSSSTTSATSTTSTTTSTTVAGTAATSATLTFAPVSGTLSLIAGDIGGAGYNDGTGTAARLGYGAEGIALTTAGDLILADTSNNTIRKISASGVVTTIAGTAGAPGSADGAGNAARFNSPAGVAVDASGDIFVADTMNQTIREITPAGSVSTVAGQTGVGGTADGTGTGASFNYPVGIALDASGNAYVADRLAVRKITAAGVVTTIAGSTASGSADGTGTAATFGLLQGIARDGAGNLYVTDNSNCTIRKIGTDGTVTTFAGSAGQCSTTDGTGNAALLYRPKGITADNAGNLYVTQEDDRVRKITQDAVVTTLAYAGADDLTAAIAADDAGGLYLAHTTVVNRIAADGSRTVVAGTATQTGAADGTVATAQFNYPGKAVADSAGNLYVIDEGNYTIRKITPDGNVTTLAGKAGIPGSVDDAGSAARFGWLSGMAIDQAGNLYVSDLTNRTIRKITPDGTVSTFAGTAGVNGSADGTGPAAQFSSPRGLAFGSDGNLYVADMGSQTIRRISPDAVVTTFAGAAGVAGNLDGTGTAAEFNWPSGLAFDSAGNLYVADMGNRTIRKITAAGVVSTIAGTAGTYGSNDATGTAAVFSQSYDIASDGTNLYVADTQNDTIRRIDASGVVTTLAGVPSKKQIVLGSLPGGLIDPSFVSVIGTNALAITSANSLLKLTIQ